MAAEPGPAQWARGDLVWVPANKPGQRWSGEIADLYPGAALVWIDGIPGLPRAILYRDLAKNIGVEAVAEKKAARAAKAPALRKKASAHG